MSYHMKDQIKRECCVPPTMCAPNERKRLRNMRERDARSLRTTEKPSNRSEVSLRPAAHVAAQAADHAEGRRRLCQRESLEQPLFPPPHYNIQRIDHLTSLVRRIHPTTPATFPPLHSP